MWTVLLYIIFRYKAQNQTTSNVYPVVSIPVYWQAELWQVPSSPEYQRDFRAQAKSSRKKVRYFGSWYSLVFFFSVPDCLNTLFRQGHGMVITAYLREGTLIILSQVTKNVILLCMHILISYSHQLQLQILLVSWMPDKHILRWFSAFSLLIQDLTQFICDRYIIVAQTSHTYVQLDQMWISA